jgi:hypothetical protein
LTRRATLPTAAIRRATLPGISAFPATSIGSSGLSASARRAGLSGATSRARSVVVSSASNHREAKAHERGFDPEISKKAHGSALDRYGPSVGRSRALRTAEAFGYKIFWAQKSRTALREMSTPLTRDAAQSYGWSTKTESDRGGMA